MISDSPSIDVDDVEISYNLACIFIQQKKFLEALKLLEDAASDEPEMHFLITSQLAHLHQLKGDKSLSVDLNLFCLRQQFVIPFDNLRAEKRTGRFVLRR